MLLNNEVVTLSDVKIIETEDGIYVQDSFKLGTSEDGEDIIQKRLTYYRRENLLKLIWTEDSLVEAITENVLSELIQDKFEHLMDIYDEEEEDEVAGTPKADGRDNPKFNPYQEKEEQSNE